MILFNNIILFIKSVFIFLKEYMKYKFSFILHQIIAMGNHRKYLSK